MLAYKYPGNIRELKNIIERAAALAAAETIADEQILFQKNSPVAKNEIPSITDTGNFLPVGDAGGDKSDFFNGNTIVKLEDLERRYILSILSFAKGNRQRAALLLGISERTLYRRLRDYE